MADEIKTTDLPVEGSTEDRAALANSANKAPPVPLAGVPETPLPEGGGDAGLGPAVPSTDHYLTDASPNQDTSSEAPEPPEATDAASGD